MNPALSPTELLRHLLSEWACGHTCQKNGYKGKTEAFVNQSEAAMGTSRADFTSFLTFCDLSLTLQITIFLQKADDFLS